MDNFLTNSISSKNNLDEIKIHYSLQLNKQKCPFNHAKYNT
jgi:hypothetical protein